MSDHEIERLTGPDAYDVVEPLVTEYLEYIADRFTGDLGVRIDDRPAFVAGRHEAIRSELPNLITGRGRLFAVRRGADVIGVGALLPVDATIAEVKRMYVRPNARGLGAGRALLDRVLDDAALEGFRTIRLETLALLTEATGLYRSAGFTERPAFANSEVGNAGADTGARYFQLEL
jgi:GNAT superfamily N-acetyltransferase